MTIFTDKAIKYVPRLQSDLNITKVQACGIFGNLGTETGGFTALQEKKPTVKGSRGGYGWMQWTGPRRVKYENWCKNNNLNPAEDETNYKYLVLETKTDEAHSLEQLKKTTTVEAATETFMKQNLRPGIANLENRINFAKQAFNAQVSQDKVATQVIVTGTAAGTGAVIAAQKVELQHISWLHDHWLFVGLGVALVIGVCIWAVHRWKEAHKQDLVVLSSPTTVAQKGKKNGKDS